MQGDFLNLLQEVQAATGITILLISPNLAVVRLVADQLAGQLADQLAVMRAGRVVDLGHAGEVLQNPRSDYTKLVLQSWSRPRRALA